MVDPVIPVALGWLGMCAALVMFLGPIPVFRVIIGSKDVQKYSPTTYVAGILNCGLWLTYSIITPDRFQPMLTNMMGGTLEIIYIVLFFYFAKASGKRDLLKQIVLAGTLYTISIAATIWLAPSLTFLQQQNPEMSLKSIFLGWVCVVVNVVLYGAPLSILRLVITTKSSHYLSISIAVGTLLCAATWSAYALCVSDINILLPNLIGILLAVVQIVVWAIYRPKAKTLAKVDTNKMRSAKHQSVAMTEMPELPSVDTHQLDDDEPQLRGSRQDSKLASASTSSLTALL
eukprot:c2330_g1_i1.p1 GENE.c2330_g1_i1~~c2330_g1_i1.p1  ORF type:complete len:311 (+),score=48.87 c2330_g1_i1:70-933(+)